MCVQQPLVCSVVCICALTRAAPLTARHADGTWKILAHDAYAWVCCTLCALCQEARTLSYNNVIDGRWLGPAVSLNGLDLASDMEKAQAMAAANAEAAASMLPSKSGSSFTLFSNSSSHGANYGVAAAGEVEPGGLLGDDSD